MSKKLTAKQESDLAKLVRVSVGQPETTMGFADSGPNPDYIPRSGILAEADDTIHGPREKEYGNKRQNFTQIAMIWQGLLAPKLLPDSRITPEDVGLLMIAVKMARLAKSPDHRDSILDIAGYAGCIDELQLQRAWPTKLQGATVDPRSAS